MDQTEALIIETIDRHREEILEFARDIYSHAELGYKEFQTSGKFVKKMEQLGLRTEKGFAITGVKAYLNEDISFVKAVREDGPVLVTGRDGLMAVRVVNAGNQSIVTGNVVEL